MALMQLLSLLRFSEQHKHIAETQNSTSSMRTNHGAMAILCRQNATEIAGDLLSEFLIALESEAGSG